MPAKTDVRDPAGVLVVAARVLVSRALESIPAPRPLDPSFSYMDHDRVTSDVRAAIESLAALARAVDRYCANSGVSEGIE